MPSIAFNCDGTKLAVGVSYTWEEGEDGAKTAERPAIYIKNVGEEVKVSTCVGLLGCATDNITLSAEGMDWQLDCYLVLCSLHCVLSWERGILSKCDMYEFGNVTAYQSTTRTRTIASTLGRWEMTCQD